MAWWSRETYNEEFRERHTQLKTCKRCFRKFEESEVDVMDVSPTTDLADIFLWDIGIEDINDLCPECRENLVLGEFRGTGYLLKIYKRGLHTYNKNYFIWFLCPRTRYRGK